MLQIKLNFSKSVKNTLCKTNKKIKTTNVKIITAAFFLLLLYQRRMTFLTTMLKIAWIPMAGGFYFFWYKFLKITQKLFQICLTPKKYLISFNHSASNCMKSLLIICSKSAKVMTKQCSGAILISLFVWIKLFKVIHLVDYSL